MLFDTERFGYVYVQNLILARETTRTHTTSCETEIVLLFFLRGPRARTQVSPTNKNFTPRHPLAWETRGAQPVCAW